MNKVPGSFERVSDIVKNTCQIDCRVVDLARGDTEPECAYYHECKAEQLRAFGYVRCEKIAQYACYQADRWGGKYEFLCPSGCGFVCASFTQDGEVAGGVLAGPFLMVELEDFLENDLDYFFQKGPSRQMVAAAKQLPVLGYQRVPYLTDMMSMLVSYLEERDPADLHALELTRKNQNEVYSSILKMKDQQSEVPYPMDVERAMQSYIAQGDRDGAQTALNTILGHIYFTSGGDFATIKARVTELGVLLSRAAIAGGANVNEVFGVSEDYLSRLSRASNMDELNDRLTLALTRFTNAVFVLPNTRHSDIIKKVLGYIHRHCDQKISLNDISTYVNFSVSYLSRIFKEETGENISYYINKTRVERAKALLMSREIPLVDVAVLSGFEDQSYFNKVFKKFCGMTPGKFREKYMLNHS